MALVLNSSSMDSTWIKTTPVGGAHVLHVNIDALPTQALSFVTGTASALGDTTLIAAPGAGMQIMVVGFQLQNESITVATALLKFGATSKYRALLPTNNNIVNPVLGSAWGVGDNVAFIVNLSTALASVGYTVWYFIR